MSSSSHRERLLEQLLCGEIDPKSNVAQQWFSEDPSLSIEFTQLRDVESRLFGAATDADWTIHQLSPTDEDRKIAADALANEWNRPRLMRRQGRSFLWAMLAIAAATAIVATISPWDNLNPRTSSPREIRRLGDAIEFVLPVDGESESFDRFRWSTDLPPGGHFEITIEATDQTIVVDRQRVLEAEFRPTDAQREAMGSHIRWTVAVFSLGSKTSFSSHTEEASLR